MLIVPIAAPSCHIPSLALLLVSPPGVWLVLTMCQVPLLLLPHLPTAITGPSPENTEPRPCWGTALSSSSVEPQSQPPLSPQIQVKQWDPAGGLAGDLRVAKLSFIDLAGSEGAWDTAGRGEGLWEGTSINRSLLALRSVVRALAGAKVRLLPAGPRRALALRDGSGRVSPGPGAERSLGVSGQGGQSHVPFRDSKLTRLLKDSLGGSCRSTVIAAVSPAAPAGPDTCSTLRFASRARHVLLPVSSGAAGRGAGGCAVGCTGGCLPYPAGISQPGVPLRAGAAGGAAAACARSAAKPTQHRAPQGFCPWQQVPEHRSCPLQPSRAPGSPRAWRRPRSCAGAGSVLPHCVLTTASSQALQLQRTEMSPCSPRAAFLPELQFQARTPSPLLQELSGHQEQR